MGADGGIARISGSGAYLSGTVVIRWVPLERGWLAVNRIPSRHLVGGDGVGGDGHTGEVVGLGGRGLPEGCRRKERGGRASESGGVGALAHLKGLVVAQRDHAFPVIIGPGRQVVQRRVAERRRVRELR